MRFSPLYSFMFVLFVFTTAHAQNQLTTSFEGEVSEDKSNLLIHINLSGEDIQLGSSGFCFDLTGEGFDEGAVQKIDSLDGKFSPAFDNASYAQLNLSHPDYYQLYLLRTAKSAANGQAVSASQEQVATVSVSITDPCGYADITWNKNKSTFSTYNSKRPNVKATLLNPDRVYFTKPIETPVIQSEDQLLSVNVQELVSFQWYMDEVAIPGATSSTFFAEEAGEYTVQLSNECESLTSESEEVDLITSVDPENMNVMAILSYPNPYDDQTKLTYHVANAAHVKLEVVDEKGISVVTLVDDLRSNGTYEVPFSAQSYGFSAGIYFAKLMIGDQVRVERLVELNFK